MTNQQADNALRVVHDKDNDTVRIIEPDGKTSVTILTAIKNDNKPYRVQSWRSTQEIINAEGKVEARTTDPAMARRICDLLIAHSTWQERKVGHDWQAAPGTKTPDKRKDSDL